jgi:hypothetical protein
MGMAGRRPAPEMMVALLLCGYCQGERSSRVVERRCGRDVGHWVITGGLCPDHATIARFRAWHQKALGGLFSQVLRRPGSRAGIALVMSRRARTVTTLSGGRTSPTRTCG